MRLGNASEQPAQETQPAARVSKVSGTGPSQRGYRESAASEQPSIQSGLGVPGSGQRVKTPSGAGSVTAPTGRSTTMDTRTESSDVSKKGGFVET